MKSKITSVLLGTLLLFAAAQQVQAGPTVILSDTTNGIICKPMMPTQSDLVEYKSWGLLNKTTTTDVWVSCPFHQLQFNVPGTTPVVLAIVDMVNRNGFEVSGSCLFREVDPTGTVVQTVSNPFTLPPNGAGVGGFFSPLLDDINSFTFACLLKRNTYIARIVHATSQTTPAVMIQLAK